MATEAAGGETVTTRNYRAQAALVLAASVSISAGCLGQGGAAVEGKLMMDGSPLKDAEVRFVPGGASGRNASAYTDAEGRYRIPAGKDGVLNLMAVKRLGNVEDIAAAVSYVTSDAAGFLTGQTICVDGGMTMC